MEIHPDCPACLRRLVERTSNLSVPEGPLRTETLAKGLEALETTLRWCCVSTQAAGEAQRAIREASGNRDPYAALKSRELEFGVALFQEARRHFADDLFSLLALSALGNAMDFFQDLSVIQGDMKKPIRFAIDDVSQLEALLPQVRRVLFLADNAGEVYFDRPLITRLSEGAEVTLAVKSAPIQDDLTLEDLMRSGVDGVWKVVTTADTPGTDLALVSKGFLKELEAADLVISKGMANYETLSDEALKPRILFLLRAKCSPVAQSLGVPLYSFVAMLR